MHRRKRRLERDWKRLDAHMRHDKLSISLVFVGSYSSLLFCTPPSY